jgi:class 3 adenylate cyclase
MGMAHGMVSNKKPLNSGRADYFGVLPNAAARVSALAAPGQVRQ